jgi:hypothetical protein
MNGFENTNKLENQQAVHATPKDEMIILLYR